MKASTSAKLAFSISSNKFPLCRKSGPRFCTCCIHCQALGASHNPSRGGGVGVGYALARSFANANASTIVLTGRHEHVLKSAAENLKAEYASVNPSLKVYTHTVDVTDTQSTGSSLELVN